MKRISVAALLALALAGCGGDEPPSVDWLEIPQYQQTAIQDAVRAGDCGRMQTYFDNSENSDVLSYLHWHMEHAGCY